MVGMLDNRDPFLLWLESVSCLSVRELNELARETLNSCFISEVWVVGEIHGLKLHAKSGHIYFDLVDKASHAADQYIAKVSCAFFKGSYLSWQRSLASLGIERFELESGIEVKLKARVDLFIKEGRYQLLVSQIDPTYTFGAIARRRAQTIEYLKAKGLMDKNKERILVIPPLNIGLITSKDSAAYRDFISIILKSTYAFRVTLFDAHMQGEYAIREITQGIKLLEGNPDVDTIVIIRGGGAKTDLFVFDDLAICKAVTECTKPVITGIGHEIDLSVADMAAHTYFVTPTDVARFLVGEADTIWNYLEDASLDLVDAARRTIDKSSQRLGTLATGLAFLTQRHTMQAHSALRSSAASLLRKGFEMLVSCEKRLLKVFSDLVHRASSGIQAQESFLGKTELALRLKSTGVLSDLRHDLEKRHALMLRDISGRISLVLSSLDKYERELNLLKPQEIMRRGYSITLDERGHTIKDSSEVSDQERITSVLKRGKVFSVVYGKEP
jgi:exodeoxyribonuclease VII large subunit